MLQTDYVIGSPLNHQDPFIQRHGSQLTANEPPPLRQPFTSRRGIRLAYSFPGPARGDSLQPDFVADIKEMTIYVRKIQVNPAVVYVHSMALQKLSAKYLFNRSEVVRMSFSYNNICVDRLANKEVIGFVSSSSVVGSYNSSPFNFQGFDLRQITLSVDGIPVNNNTVSVSYDSSTGYDTVEAYVSLLQST